MQSLEQPSLPSLDEQLDDIAVRRYQTSLDLQNQAEIATGGFGHDEIVIAELGLAQAICAKRAQEVRPYLQERGLLDSL